MAVTWRNTQNITTTGATTITVTKPTGTVDGDLLILQLVQNTLTQTVTRDLQDWKEIPNTNLITGSRFTALYYKYASSEPASYTFTTIVSSVYKISLTSFYGVGNVAIDTYATQINATSTNRVWPSLTMSAAGMLACFGSMEQTTVPPASMTERIDVATISMYLMTESVSVGATGTRTGTGTTSTSLVTSIGLIEGPARVFYGIYNISSIYLIALSSAGTRTINLPTGVINGDLLILSIAYTIDATPTLPAGWTLIQSSITGSNTLRTYYKLASSEASSYTITWTGTNTVTIGISAFRSYKAWPITLITSDQSTNTSTPTIAYPALTPTQINQLLVLFAAYNGNVTISAVHPIFKRIGYQSGTTIVSLFSEYLLTTSSTTGRTSTISAGFSSKVVSAIFAADEPTPNAPTTLTATSVGQNQIDLTWADNNNYATSIKIERSLTGVGAWTEIDSVAIGIQAYSSTGLSTSTTYYYRIRALVETVYSTYSSNASAATYAGLLAPTGLLADAYQPRKILITWTNPNADSTGNELERSPNGSTGWVLIATVLHGTNEYRDVTRTPETIYYYRVRSYKVT